MTFSHLEIEKEELKWEDRTRRIPVTEKLEMLFREVVSRTDSTYEYVFSMKDGSRFDPDKFRESAWETAFRRAEMNCVNPYATRHTFAAWSLTLRMNPNRLVYLMGHSTKKMIYENYGRYVEDLEQGAPKIFEYLGKDFIRKNFRKTFYAFLESESLSESQEVTSITTCNNDEIWRKRMGIEPTKAISHHPHRF